MIDESEANIFISDLRPTRWYWVTEHRINLSSQGQTSITQSTSSTGIVLHVRGTYVREKMCVLVFGVGN